MCTLVGRDGKHKRERGGSVYTKEMHATSSDLCKYMCMYIALSYYLLFDGLCIMHHLNLEFCNYYEAMEAACRPLQVHIVMHSNIMLLQKMPKKYQGREIGGRGGE